jgi:crotonobetainyl-CoA:carnitine CoA-transferase CaiB-like acyl-CoA transferase
MTENPGTLPGKAALGRFAVLDLSRVRSGPTCVRQLADYGAQVIKIEPPKSIEPDDTGGFGPRHGSDFQNIHRNKRSLTLNLKEPEAVAILKRLAAQSDVLVENFRPDVKDRLGIGYADLKAVNPRLVYASISGFGQDGPYAQRPGFDQIAQGMGGLMAITGQPGQGPIRAGIPIADLTAGIFCAIGILIALLEREVSGEGQFVDSSLLGAQISMLDFQAARWLMEGQVAQQVGNAHPTGAATNAYPTADGYVNIAATGPIMWPRMCKAMKADALLNNPDYADDASRLKHRDKLDAEIAAITRTAPTAEWVDRLNEFGVASGPIHTIDKMFDDPQVKHLGMATPVEHPTLGKINVVAQPVRLSRTPAELVSAAPDRGDHTDAILGELGFGADQIADMRARKVV